VEVVSVLSSSGETADVVSVILTICTFSGGFEFSVLKIAVGYESQNLHVELRYRAFSSRCYANSMHVTKGGGFPAFKWKSG